jgi:hypothetical protein
VVAVDPYAPGQILDGKYLVERKIGEGGMGQVLLARHTELDRNVAIKVLRADLAMDASAVERFLREARAAARIESEHVVQVFDVERFSDGRPYIVMEYLEGEDLGRVAARGVLPVAQAVECILHACEGVAEAHRVGVIHRDLKPENLFLARRRDGGATLKVVDFGISKLAPTADRREQALTTGNLLGTPFYMSPEQLRGDATVDERSDVWALGVILFELVTGGAPFHADTLPTLCLRIMNEPARRISDERSDLAFPIGLEGIIDRCLSKAPEQRYPNAVELGAALAMFAPAFDAARLGPMRPRGPSLADGAALARSGVLPRVQRRRRWRPIATVAAAVALFGVAVFGVAKMVASAPTPPTASATTSASPVVGATTGSANTTAGTPPLLPLAADTASAVPASTRSARSPASSTGSRPAPTKSATIARPLSDDFGGRL